ncbi:MAG: MFS transporter [Gammaproteobacteria bacterium]
MTNKKTRREISLLTPQFALLLLATGTFGVAFSTYFLMPKYLAVVLAADAVTIGAVSAVTLLASVVAMPFIGVHVDRHGRKTFGVIGAATFGLACLGFIWIDSVGPFLWLVRIVQGAAFTLFYVSISTLATDITPPARRGQAIGLFGAVMISTNAIGPALSEWAAAAFSWKVVFAGTVFAALISAVLTLCISEKTHRVDHHRATSMLEVLQRPGLLRVLAVAAIAGWTMGAVYTFYQPWALSRGFEQVSSFLIAFALFAMLVRVGLGSLADRLGRLRVSTVALFLYVGAPLSLIYLDIFGLFFAGAILGLAHGLFFPALNAVALDRTLDNERGKGMAAYHGSFNIGFAAGSYLLGFVAMAAGYPVVFAIAAISCFSAFVLLATIPKSK